MKMIGVCAERARLRISAAVSRPSMPGMLTSRRITAKSRSSTCFNACSPESAMKIFMADSGEQALKQVLERDFAVILLDVNMPGMDGLETAALIRNRARSAHTPIIFITADYNDEPHMARGYALGGVDYIGSPVMPEILRAKVRVFVDQYLLAQQAKRQAQEKLAFAEERVARATAEQASRRLAFLAQASATLTGSLDVATITRELVRLCVPTVADACALTLVAQAPEE